MNFICVYQVWSKLIEECPPKSKMAATKYSFLTFCHFNIRSRWFPAHHRDRLVLYLYAYLFINFLQNKTIASKQYKIKTNYWTKGYCWELLWLIAKIFLERVTLGLKQKKYFLLDWKNVFFSIFLFRNWLLFYITKL